MVLICNLTKKEYLDPAKFGEESALPDVIRSYQGSMTGLVVLASDGNGRGGGDLHVTSPLIGSWAGDAVVITDEPSAMDATGATWAEIQANWSDRSGDISEVIKAGEGVDGWIPAWIDPRSPIPVTWQRRCLQTVWCNALNWDGLPRPIASLDILFAMFGETVALTPGVREARLQSGITNLGKALGCEPAYQVTSLELVWSKKGDRVDKAVLTLVPRDAHNPALAPLTFFFTSASASQRNSKSLALLRHLYPSLRDIARSSSTQPTQGA